MSCEAYRDIIDKYVEGLATPDERAALEEHMKTCAECKSEVEDIGRIIRAFDSFESVDLPLDFMPSLHEKLLRVQAERTRTRKMMFFPGFIRDLAVSFHDFYRQNSKILAAGLCVVLLSFFMGRFFGPPIDHQAKTGNAVEHQMAKPESADTSSKSEQSSATAEGSLDENNGQSDINEDSEKKLMMAGSPAPVDGKSKEETQKDAAMVTRSGDAEQSTASSKSFRDGNAKDASSLNGDIQYRALQESGPKAAAAAPYSQKGIQSDQITICVDDFDKKVVSAIGLAGSFGGNIRQSEITDNGDNSRKAYIVMKVPVEDMASALERIRTLGETRQDIKEPQDETAGKAKALEAEKAQGQEEKQEEGLSDDKTMDKASSGQDASDSDKDTADKKICDKGKDVGIIRINIIEKVAAKEPSD